MSTDDVSFDEDGSGSTSLSGNDVDGDDLSYSIAGGSDITAVLDGSDIAFTATENFSGSELFTVSVTDGDLSDSQDITVTVNPVNDAPIAEDVLSQTDEDVSIDIALSATDIDSDTLTYLLVEDSSDGFVSITGSTANFTPDQDFNGSTTFTYRVTDGELTSNIATVTVSILPINDAPILSLSLIHI